jgi:Leucine-rich repeat (LRR) protein
VIGGRIQSGNKVLKRLPESLGNLQSLRFLRLDKCKELLELPDSLGELKQLRTLHMRECKAMKSLPGSIGNLTNLVDLSLSKCIGLDSLPPSIGNCASLEDMILNKCKGFTELPESICELKRLCYLDLRGKQAYTYICLLVFIIAYNFGLIYRSHCFSLQKSQEFAKTAWNSAQSQKLESFNLQTFGNLAHFSWFVGQIGSLECI